MIHRPSLQERDTDRQTEEVHTDRHRVDGRWQRTQGRALGNMGPSLENTSQERTKVGE